MNLHVRCLFPLLKAITSNSKSIETLSTNVLAFLRTNLFLSLVCKVSLEEKVASGARDDNANQYFSILQTGCETRVAKLMEISLDAVHYLIGAL